MNCSAARREATPASARNFWRRRFKIVKSSHREPLNRSDDLIIQRFNALRVWFGFAQTRDAVASLPLAAFLEKFSALKTLEDIALAAKGGRRAQTAML